MQAPFDIAADLDTPVSAYLKLRDLKPRFLLESVEGGERLARYSFLGFGDALEVRMEGDALTVNGESGARPENQQQYLDALRAALAQAPRPGPEVEGLPFAGGLVGVSGYDVVRLFERPEAVARAYSVRRVDIVPDLDAAFARILQPRFRPREAAVVLEGEWEDPAGLLPAECEVGPDTSVIESLEPTEVVITTSGPSPPVSSRHRATTSSLPASM